MYLLRTYQQRSYDMLVQLDTDISMKKRASPDGIFELDVDKPCDVRNVV